MMMKPSMENASSPQDEMAVPNAMMLTAMVTCHGDLHQGRGSAQRCKRRTGVDSLSSRAATRMTMVITGVAAFRI